MKSIAAFALAFAGIVLTVVVVSFAAGSFFPSTSPALPPPEEGCSCEVQPTLGQGTEAPGTFVVAARTLGELELPVTATSLTPQATPYVKPTAASLQQAAYQRYQTSTAPSSVTS